MHEPKQYTDNESIALFLECMGNCTAVMGQDDWCTVHLAELFSVTNCGTHAYALAQAINVLGQLGFVRVCPDSNRHIDVKRRIRTLV